MLVLTRVHRGKRGKMLKELRKLVDDPRDIEMVSR